MAEGQTYKFSVAMSCGGCSGAIDRVLKKLDGVNSYDVSLENQTAVVNASPDLPFSKVLETIKKTGKEVKSAEVDGVPQTL